MKNLVLAAAFCLSASAFAEGSKVSCGYGETVQDATTTAVFTATNTKTPKVELGIPEGESTIRMRSGICQHDEGAIELAITCNVFTSTDSGYTVRLYSPGGTKLFASVQSWNMSGQGKPEHLPVCK